MNSPEIENFLAKLYTDSALRKAFLQNPQQVMQQQALSSGARLDLATLDLPGLKLAAASYARKREGHRTLQAKPLQILVQLFSRW